MGTLKAMIGRKCICLNFKRPRRLETGAFTYLPNGRRK